jgi:hypothetical protein
MFVRTERLFKYAAFAVCFIFFLAAASPALAKGFSSGGRSSFSSGKSFSSGRSYSTGGRSFTTPKAVSSPAGGESAASSASGSAGRTVGSSPRNSFTTGTKSFSTPRQDNPPAMYQDYSTGAQSYSTGRRSYETGRTSYSGSGVPDLERTKYPARPPVTVFGPAPQPPEYYHDYYWGLPFWARLFFNPYYYWTPWGYHFFAPRLLTWLLLLCLLGLGAFYLLNRFRRQ